MGIRPESMSMLGDRWRLPTDEEWRQLASHYGGVSADSKDGGKAAYRALSAGGSSGFKALLGGGRAGDGQSRRLEAHGFYWAASESDAISAWYYNFASGGQALHRQNGGEKERAFSFGVLGQETESECCISRSRRNRSISAVSAKREERRRSSNSTFLFVGSHNFLSRVVIVTGSPTPALQNVPSYFGCRRTLVVRTLVNQLESLVIN